MKNQKVWIKANSKNQDADDVMAFILSLGDEGLLGEIPVIVCYSDTRERKRLSHIYDLDVSAVNVLREKYGDENVKLTEIQAEEPFTEKLINALERIADSLESVSDSLEELEPLSQCVVYVPPNHWQKEGHHFLRIGGSVDTGNY